WKGGVGLVVTFARLRPSVFRFDYCYYPCCRSSAATSPVVCRTPSARDDVVVVCGFFRHHNSQRGNAGELRMKTTYVFAVAFASLALAAPPVQHSINVALGPKAYRDGDVIEITEVTATSDRLEQGDSITARGRVRLDSRSSGNLCLFLTQ